MKSILIRCDANEANGYGHLSRCLNIARGIKENNQDYQVTFVGDYSPKAVFLMKKYYFNFLDFSEHNPESAKSLISIVKDIDYFILDSYKISQQYLNEL